MESLFVVAVVRVKWASKPEASFPRLCWYAGRPVVVAAGQYSPSGAGELVGHGNDDDVLVSPGVEPVEPGSNRCSISLDTQHGCSSAMDQDLAQVDVAALADA